MPKDKSAKLARAAEEKRQGLITQGDQSISDAFGVFNDPYYNQYRDTYANAYTPQLDQQYGKARQDVTYSLARRGMENSTPGQTSFADLVDRYTAGRQDIASKALSATDQLKSSVAATKANLQSANEAAASPSAAARNAVASVGALQTTPQYSPLADVFGGLTGALGAYQAGQSQGISPYAQQQLNQYQYRAPAAASPSRIVR